MADGFFPAMPDGISACNVFVDTASILLWLFFRSSCFVLFRSHAKSHSSSELSKSESSKLVVGAGAAATLEHAGKGI
jgi:hypothetical protein